METTVKMPVISRLVVSGMGIPYHFATQCQTMRETMKPEAVFRLASSKENRRDWLIRGSARRGTPPSSAPSRTP